MLSKIVAIFLVIMAVLAMFGKLRVPGSGLGKKLSGLRRRRLNSGRCPKCNTPLIGKGPCPCGHKSKGA